MSKLLLLYLTLVVGLVFLLMPNGTPVDYFPFYDIELYPKTYVYFIFEKSILIILAGIIYNEATEYRQALWVFLWLLVADLIDFGLTYNTAWYHFGAVPMSMNVLKSVIFGIVILRELWKKSYR